MIRRLSAVALIGAGACSTTISISTLPFPVEIAAIGIGLIGTGVIVLASNRLKRSTWILSSLLLWSLLANVCLALSRSEAFGPGRR